ncbi:MAG: FkbM family methyltransferase [Sphingomonadales bacterium]
MTEYLSRNRLLAAAQLGLQNPVSAASYVVNRARKSRSQQFFQIGDIGLWVRAHSPDLNVVRACLLGEFDEAMALTRPDARFIVDAGGYIGLVSILFARRFPDARIICLEPSSENYAIAHRNCAPFPNVTVLNCALGPASGSAVLQDRGTGQWGFTITQAQGAKAMEEVVVVTLPELMDAHGAARVDLLKLDIEGAEFDLFQTAHEWIDRCEVMITELHEKIRPGVEDLYARVTDGRLEVSRDAEKRLSVLRSGGA